MNMPESQSLHAYVREAQITYRPTGAGPEHTRAVSNSRLAASILQPVIGHRITESLLVLALDVRHRPLGYHEVARGSVSACPVRLSDLFRYPILVGAEAILLAHNHPSGDPSPSPEDEALTRLVAQAGAMLGVKLLDHLILAADGHYSFLDSGTFPRP